MPTDQSIDISELFYSIQGESSFSGYPCVFIRLAGCNLRCSYCDARYTYEEPATPCSLGAIIDFADRHPAAIVEITGGEPLLQKNVYPLMAALLDRGRTVLLETNGSLSLAMVPEGVVKIMDLKCPGSGMHDKMAMGNLQYLTADDELKFVVTSPADYRWAVQTMTDHLQGVRPAILFSPVAGTIEPAKLAELILADGLQARLQLQLHTLLWPHKKRGA